MASWDQIILKVKRVQKYVETLDMLKIKNSMPSNNGDDAPMQQPQQKKHSNGPSRLGPIQEQPTQMQSNGHIDLLTPVEEPQYTQPRNSNGHSQLIQQPQAPVDSSSTSEVVVTTKWETFEPAPPLMPATLSTSANNNSVHPRFNWEFFD